jgi:hypothetical protein
MITTPAEPKEIIYPKMPNKGLRKMQAKPLLNITKQKTKIMSTISNFKHSYCNHRDDAEVIGLKIQKRAVAVLTAQIAVKVCRTLSLEGIEDLAEDNLNKARVNNGTLIVNDDQYIQKKIQVRSSGF